MSAYRIGHDPERNASVDRRKAIDDADFEKRKCRLNELGQQPADPELEHKIAEHEASTRRARELARDTNADDRSKNRQRPTLKRSRKRTTELQSSPTFATATTPDELVMAAAMDCLSNRPPPPWRELVAWWGREGPREIATKARTALFEVLGTNSRWVPWSEANGIAMDVSLDFGARAATGDAVSDDVQVDDVRAFHFLVGQVEILDMMEYTRRWLKLQEPRPRHAVSIVFDGWRQSPVSTEWDNRRYANLPGPLVKTRHIVLDRDLSAGQAHLPFDYDSLAAAVPPDQPRFEVGYLPTLEPEPSLLPLALLNVFSTTASPGRHGPVPVAARIGWEVLIALGGEDRERIEGPAILNCTLGDLHRSVYPATSDRWHKKNGPTLLRGLHNLDKARLRWRGDARGGLYPLVEVYRLPNSARPDEPLVFLSHLPPSSRQGPQVDRVILRALAARSAREHRMMLIAYCLFDRYGTVNGRLISPTLPVVRRDSAGYVLSTSGKVQSEKNGTPTRRATHRRAVQTGARERNPETERYPWLEGRDLILAGYPVVGATTAARRIQKHRIMAAATALRKVGHIDFEAKYRPVRGGRELVGLRLLPSTEHVAAHSARWAAREHG